MKKPCGLPDHLGEIWDEMVPQVMMSIGEAGMEALCVQVYRMRDAQARITLEGSIVANERGNPVEHPSLAIERQAQREIREWLKIFRRHRGSA